MNPETAGWATICRLEEIGTEGMYPFEVGEQRIAVYRLADSFYATDNVCSHAFALLTDGWLDGNLVECPLHGAQFDVTTGEVARGPADCPVLSYPTRIRDGALEVRLLGRA